MTGLAMCVVRYNIMNKTYTEAQKQSLPPLPGHKKLNKTALLKTNERKNSEEDSSNNPNRIATSSDRQSSHLRLTSERKTLQSVNSSKGVKYETASALCLKKIDILQRQNAMLDKELVTVREEINQLRTISRLGDDDTLTVSSKATTRRSEDKLFQKTESRPLINRLDVLRNKIDKENQKNRKIQKQIDKVRKEIHTTKKLNEQIQNQLKDATSKHMQQENTASVLDQEINTKNEQVRLKKIESIHQQAHLIKNYDSILKKLDQQLGTDKGKQTTEPKESRAEFYITNIANQRQPRKANTAFAESTPKAKKTAAQMTFLKEKISQYEDEFNELRQKTGSQTIEEVTKKFLEEYEANFGVYNFINETHAHLQDLKQRNAELKMRQEQIRSQQLQKRKSRAFNEVEKSKAKIQQVSDSINEIKGKLQNCDNQYRTLKQFVISFASRIPLQQTQKKYHANSQNVASILNPQNILEFLQEILSLKETLENIKHPPEHKNDMRNSHLTSSNANHDMVNSTRSHLSSHLLEEYLQAAKRQTSQDKEQLFSRQDFLRNKEANLVRKKASASKLRAAKI